MTMIPADVEARAPRRAATDKLAYVVCAAPGAGGTRLCEALSDTGCAGRPAEYFDVDAGRRSYWSLRLGVDDPARYLEKVIEAGTTPNGVFGLHLHWRQVTALMAAFGADPRAIDIDARLASRFETRRYVWLRRRNTVAQAISNYRAIAGSVWRLGPNLAEPPVREVTADFNLERIEHHVALVEHSDRQWQTWFRLSRQRALVVIDEDFREKYEETVRAICDFIGVGGGGYHAPAPRFEAPADAVSLEWEAEYRRIKGLPGSERSGAPRPAPQVTLLRDPPGRTTRVEATPPPVRANEAPPSAPDAGRIIAYDVGGRPDVRLVAAPSRRAWMDTTPSRFANRCLPLLIANQHGWLMLAPHRIEALWTGGDGFDDVVIHQETGESTAFAVSHFGSGILTFKGHYLFRTPRGINLHVRGPANLPKDGIAPLEGVVETDWSEVTFTMNWKFTRPNWSVVFEANEPFAMISPVRRGDVEAYRPEIHPLASKPELDASYRAWSASRTAFNRRLREADPTTRAQGWQRHYARGETITGAKAAGHQTKLVVSEFEDYRTPRIVPVVEASPLAK